ncbi:MAG TPA: glycosyltransferase family 2 protein [Rhodoglobus sp.]|nr:glycosyltransferase family 2 protein [Rhodoglobus sp.]
MPTTSDPGVSYVMPVLNEVEHIEAAIDGITAQDYPGPYEIITALGPSVDGTNDVIRALAAQDPHLRPIPNELGSTPGGLNAAIRAARYDVVIRVDAHSVLPPDYARIAVRTLQQTGADNVGGIMQAEGVTPFEKAVAHAYRSPEGLGGTAHHVGGKPGPAETVYLGSFRKQRLFDVGLFDEGIKRGQDWELNRRLRTTGGVVWFTPDMKVVYRPRSSLRKLVRQFVATGIWRGELARRFGSSFRYFVPPLAVIGSIAGIILGVVGIATATPWLTAALAVPGLYALLVIAASLKAAREGARVGLWYLVVLPCIHFGWGVGFIAGYLKLAKNITAQTGR